MLCHVLLSSIVMTILYLVYKCLLADTSFHRLNRFIILSIYAISWSLPFLRSISLNSTENAGISNTIEIGLIQTPTIAHPGNYASSQWLTWLLWLWLAGMSVCFIMFLISAVELRMILVSGIRTKCGRFTEIVTDDAPGPFSWMNYIVLRPKDLSENVDLIRAHELAHVRRMHWIDVLIARITVIFQWFSPAAWLLMRDLKENHEFEVDSMVCCSDPDRYQLMLIKMTVGARLPVLADSLNHSKLKKRLTMMMTKKSSPSRRFATAAIPAAALVALAVIASPSIARVSHLLSDASLIPESGKAVFQGKDNNSFAPGKTLSVDEAPTTGSSVSEEFGEIKDSSASQMDNSGTSNVSEYKKHAEASENEAANTKQLILWMESYFWVRLVQSSLSRSLQ